jgi:hypothetical protein
MPDRYKQLVDHPVGKQYLTKPRIIEVFLTTRRRTSPLAP